MLCISISDSPVLTNALAGITKHGIRSKHFAFWIKVLFSFIDANWSIKFNEVTDNTGSVRGRSRCATRWVRGPLSHRAPGIPLRHGDASQILHSRSAQAGACLSRPDHKMIHAPRDTFKWRLWMKSIPEKNLLWNRKSETAAELCLSWVISSLYSLIIDTALIRMTDPNVALCLCIFCCFLFY